MAYHVQALLTKGPTQFIGWFECGELLSTSFEEGFQLKSVWSNTILMDKKGLNDSEVRSISTDETAQSYRKLINALRQNALIV